MTCKVKILTYWIIFLILENIIELALRLFSRIDDILEINSLNITWNKDIWYPLIDIFSTFTNMWEVLSYCIMIIIMS